MLQPFELFLPIYLDRLLKLNKIYLVIQTNLRGSEPMKEGQKINILVTDYEDINNANEHFESLKADKNASLIHLDNPLHKNKLDEMLHGEKYTVYWNELKNKEELDKIVDSTYSDQIKKYIKRNTSWRIGADETVSTNYEVTVGEFYITLTYNTNQLKVKFEEIEK
jgi:S-adenosylmethionine:tRNA-ribosyltransferase-isomerase (queuine synthetase)